MCCMHNASLVGFERDSVHSHDPFAPFIHFIHLYIVLNILFGSNFQVSVLVIFTFTLTLFLPFFCCRLRVTHCVSGTCMRLCGTTNFAFGQLFISAELNNLKKIVCGVYMIKLGKSKSIRISSPPSLRVCDLCLFILCLS